MDSVIREELMRAPVLAFFVFLVPCIWVSRIYNFSLSPLFVVVGYFVSFLVLFLVFYFVREKTDRELKLRRRPD